MLLIKNQNFYLIKFIKQAWNRKLKKLCKNIN